MILNNVVNMRAEDVATAVRCGAFWKHEDDAAVAKKLAEGDPGLWYEVFAQRSEKAERVSRHQMCRWTDHEGTLCIKVTERYPANDSRNYRVAHDGDQPDAHGKYAGRINPYHKGFWWAMFGQEEVDIRKGSKFGLYTQHWTVNVNGKYEREYVRFQ